MIIHKSFKHGWFYHYRIHQLKAENLCNHKFFGLNKYLHEVYDSCPDEYFHSGPRGSGLRMPLDVDIKKISGHEVCDLAQAGLDAAKYKTAHSNVQMFMLEHDDKTVSVEVPIWMLEEEFSGYKELFNTSEALTGHIDALRVEDGKVWVWDYKPNAWKEKFAATQVQFYALMLSKRSNIPLEQFRCGYFDDEEAYIFKPKTVPKFKLDVKS